MSPNPVSEVTNRKRLAVPMAALGAALLLVIGGMVLAPPSADPTPSPPGGGKCASQEARTFVVVAKLVELGFTSEELRLEGEFDLSLPGVQDRGHGSFSEAPVTGNEELVEFLNATAEGSVAARDRVVEAIPQEQHEAALAGENWVGIQFVSPIVFVGNTTYVDGQAVDAGHRESLQGDIWWFYVDPNNCEIYINAAVRGPCGNPQQRFPRPVQPVEPATPGSPGKPKPPGETPVVTVPNEAKKEVSVPGPGGPDSGQAPNTYRGPPDKPEDHDFNKCKKTGYCGQTKPQTPITPTPTTRPPPEVTSPVTTPVTGEHSTGIVEGP